MDRTPRNAPNALWEEWESHVCRLTGGAKTQASGRLSDKGDVRAADLFIECKQRAVGATYSFTADWLATAAFQADAKHLVPLIAFWPTPPADRYPFRGLYLVRDGDAALFQPAAPPGALTRVPEGWVLVTEESVQAHCRAHDESFLSHAFPQKRGASFGGGSSLGGGPSGFSGSGGKWATGSKLGGGKGFRK